MLFVPTNNCRPEALSGVMRVDETEEFRILARVGRNRYCAECLN